MNSNRKINITNNIDAFSALVKDMKSVEDLINKESSTKSYTDSLTKRDVVSIALGLGVFVTVIFGLSRLPTPDHSDLPPGAKAYAESCGAMFKFFSTILSLIPLGTAIAAIDFQTQPLSKLSDKTLTKSEKLLSDLKNLNELKNIDLTSPIETFLKEVSCVRETTSAELEKLKELESAALIRREQLQSDLQALYRSGKLTMFKPITLDNASELIRDNSESKSLEVGLSYQNKM